MKDELITFETAKLAKDKNFICNSYNKMYNQDGNIGSPYRETYAIYTQSLVQRWLREKHNISIKIDDYITKSKLRFDYSICHLGLQDENPIGFYKTYEEALEEGLKEALKLITV